jgi:chromosome segregation ATPase
MGDNERDIADLKARMRAVEDDLKDIKEEQREVRNISSAAKDREMELGTQLQLLNKSIQDHLKLHSDGDNKRLRSVDVFFAIGMLITAGISAYGAVAMIALTKAVTK